MLGSFLYERLSTVSPSLVYSLKDTAIKGVAILSLVALVTLAMRSASAAARHLAWFLGTLGLLILPIFSAALPAWHILPQWTSNNTASSKDSFTAMAAPMPAITSSATNVSLRGDVAMPQVETPASALTPTQLPVPAHSRRHTWQTRILVTWLAGSALLLGYVVMGFVSLWWLERRSSRLSEGSWAILLRQHCGELGFRGRVELLSSPRRMMPMTWGLWRTRLLLPEDSASWTVDQRRAVLLHELAHARRWDCLTQLVAQVACAFYWFNPLVWLAWNRMQVERERACDDLVLNTGTKASAYAEQLLRIASEMPLVRFSAAAIAMARSSKLEGRLRAILNVTRNRQGLTWTGLAVGGVLLLAVTVPLSILRAAERPALSGAAAVADLQTQSALRSDDSALAAIAARLDTLQNITAKYDAVMRFTPPQDLLDRMSPAMREHVPNVLNHSETRTDTYHFMHGIVLLDSVPSRDTIKQLEAIDWPISKHDINSFSPGRAESLNWPSKGRGGAGLIDKSILIPDAWTLDLALGLRMYRNDYGLTPAEFLDARIVSSSPMAIRVRLDDSHRTQHFWTFDPTLGYALRMYEVAVPDGRVYDRTECSDFRQFGGLMLPMKIVRTGTYMEKGQTHTAKTILLTVASYVVPDTKNVAANFLIIWPKGSLILENRAKLQLSAVDKDRTFDDAAIAAEVRRQGAAATKPASRPTTDVTPAEKVKRVRAAIMINRYLIVSRKYAAAHDGSWPDSLPSLSKDENVSEESATNVKPEYIRPPSNLDDSAAQSFVVLVEPHDKWNSGINVGFANGQVRFITDRAEFDKLLKSSRDRSVR